MQMRRSISFMLLLSLVGFASDGVTQTKTVYEITASDIMTHIKILASQEFGGRGAGTDQERKAAAYVAGWFEEFGLLPAGDSNSYFQVFDFVGGVRLGENNRLTITHQNKRTSYDVNTDFRPYGFSTNANVAREAVFAGYGITSEENKYDDYKGIDVNGKIVVIIEGSPAADNPHSTLQTFGNIRYKTSNAKDHGAAAVIVYKGFTADAQDALPELTYSSVGGDAGLPVVFVTRNVIAKLFENTGKHPEKIEKSIREQQKPESFSLPGKKLLIASDVVPENLNSQNVVGYLEGSDPVLKQELIVIGAHYDHLGLGGENSLTPSRFGEVHNGADDNASGTAGLLELAQWFASDKNNLRRSLLFIAFGAEERGLLGSDHYVNNPTYPLDKVNFMLNLDMIGRMENNALTINGTGSSPIWDTVVNEANKDFDLKLSLSEGAFGGSDHTSFYNKQIPVLFFFTGTHRQYHTPDDDFERINEEGEEKLLLLAENLIRKLDASEEKIAFTRVNTSQSQGSRTSFKVTFGIVPDYAGSNEGGLKVLDVREEGPAYKAGVRADDTIIKIGEKDVKNIYDYMFMLGKLNPGDKTEVIIVRGEEKLTLTVAFEKK